LAKRIFFQLYQCITHTFVYKAFIASLFVRFVLRPSYSSLTYSAIPLSELYHELKDSVVSCMPSIFVAL